MTLMPVTIKKIASGGFRVSTPNMVHSKHTTFEKAKSQERLLNAVDHGWKPSQPNPSELGGFNKGSRHVKKGMSY